MKELKELYVVEYSVQGRCTHIHTVDEMLQTNLENVMAGISNDYKPVAIADSADEAMKEADVIEEKFGTVFNR